MWYDSHVAFVRWDPLRDLLAIQQRLNRLSPGPAGWTPPVDLLETPDAYILTMELSGINQDEVQLQLRDGRLTIAGVRRERESAFEQYHQIERGHGSFSRSFNLPEAVETDHVTADLRDGVLTVTCPKSSEGPARRIDIT